MDFCSCHMSLTCPETQLGPLLPLLPVTSPPPTPRLTHLKHWTATLLICFPIVEDFASTALPWLENKCSLGIAFQVTASATPLRSTFSFPCATSHLLLVLMVATLALCSVRNVLPLFSNLGNLSHTAKFCTIVFFSMKLSLEHFPECTTLSVLLQAISRAYAQHLFLLPYLVISFPF